MSATNFKDAVQRISRMLENFRKLLSPYMFYYIQSSEIQENIVDI